MDTAQLATALAAGRIAIGLGFVLAPATGGARWIGEAAHDPAVKVMTRGLGIRDLALGAATLGTLRATGTEGQGFKVLTALGIACDVVDTVSTLAAGEDPPAKVVSAAVALGAAGAGVAILTGALDAADAVDA